MLYSYLEGGSAELPGLTHTPLCNKRIPRDAGSSLINSIRHGLFTSSIEEASIYTRRILCYHRCDVSASMGLEGLHYSDDAALSSPLIYILYSIVATQHSALIHGSFFFTFPPGRRGYSCSSSSCSSRARIKRSQEQRESTRSRNSTSRG